MQAAWVQEERCDYKQFVIARGGSTKPGAVRVEA